MDLGVSPKTWLIILLAVSLSVTTTLLVVSPNHVLVPLQVREESLGTVGYVARGEKEEIKERVAANIANEPILKNKPDKEVEKKKIAILYVFQGELYKFINYTVKSISFSRRIDHFVFTEKPINLGFTAPNFKVVVIPDLKKFYPKRVAECLGMDKKSQVYTNMEHLYTRNPYQLAGFKKKEKYKI